LIIIAGMRPILAVIIVVYKNANLPLNQLTVYDGLQYVPMK
jgi:hypothetical protein